MRPYFGGRELELMSLGKAHPEGLHTNLAIHTIPYP